MDFDDILALVGRLFIAVIFLASAFGKLTNYSDTVKYMETHGIPCSSALCLLAAAVEVLGGIFLIVGYGARWGAAALAVFLVIATGIFHTGPEQRIHLLKNIAILGGLLEIMAFGPGALSLEGRRRSPA